jgi:cysteinyl-tRNA synthetase
MRPLPRLVLLSLLVPACEGQVSGGTKSDASVQPVPDLRFTEQGAPVFPEGGAPPSDSKVPQPGNPLSLVKYWAYQIQGVHKSGAVANLVASRYDMLVLEPTNTDRNNSSFDGKGMVQKLHATNGKSGHKRLVIAYIDIGEAESWRYYWKSSWVEPTHDEWGTPDFLLAPDPDGWVDNFVVAFWDKRWKDIMIYNSDSMLNRAIDDGYDGIYMDWIEGFIDKDVKQAASGAGKDPAVEMIQFIREIRKHARSRNPAFLVIAQNAPELATGHAEYFKEIDAIAHEQVFFDGKADTKWDDSDACDIRVPDTGQFSRQYYIQHLKPFLAAKLPVFNCEYACGADNVKESYDLSAKEGYVTYVSRRPLDRLTSDPPPGY